MVNTFGYKKSANKLASYQEKPIKDNRLNFPKNALFDMFRQEMIRIRQVKSLLWEQGVVGSNPTTPTLIIKHL
jgi:hypothetical protein